MSALFPERIETDRLLLEAVPADSLDVFDLYDVVRVGAPNIDEITEYLTWSPHETPKETREFLDSVAEERENDDGSMYVVRPKQGEDGTGELAGLAGIGVNWETRTAEFGTWLRKRFWGRGYSGERAAAFLEVAFERLDLDAVVVTVQRGNENSFTAVSRYVEAHGGSHEGLLRNFYADQDGAVADAHRFSITREEYHEVTGE